MTPQHISHIVLTIAVTVFVMLVGFASGRAERVVKLRSSCDVERAYLLKPSWYYTTPSEFVR